MSPKANISYKIEIKSGNFLAHKHTWRIWFS